MLEPETLSESEIKEHINIEEPRINNWWAYWEYLPDNQKSTTPNFKELNDAYVDLFDDKKFDGFIELCVSKINELFEK